MAFSQVLVNELCMSFSLRRNTGCKLIDVDQWSPRPLCISVTLHSSPRILMFTDDMFLFHVNRKSNLLFDGCKRKQKVNNVNLNTFCKLTLWF